MIRTIQSRSKSLKTLSKTKFNKSKAWGKWTSPLQKLNKITKIKCSRRGMSSGLKQNKSSLELLKLLNQRLKLLKTMLWIKQTFDLKQQVQASELKVSNEPEQKQHEVFLDRFLKRKWVRENLKQGRLIRPKIILIKCLKLSWELKDVRLKVVKGWPRL